VAQVVRYLRMWQIANGHTTMEAPPKLLKRLSSEASTLCGSGPEQLSSEDESQSEKEVTPRKSWRDRSIRFAVPTDGGLHDDTIKLLDGAGLGAKCADNLNMKLVCLPSADIPMYVMEGIVDFGITASHMLEEALLGAKPRDGEGVKVLLEPGFGECKLCLQAPKDMCSMGPEAFVNRRIATPFPALTKKYFEGISKGRSQQTRVKSTTGSAEVAYGLGLADAIVEPMEASKMNEAGLDVVSEIFSSTAVIVQPMRTEELDSPDQELTNLVMKRINGYLTSTRFILVQYKARNLEACLKVTPGKRSPTVRSINDDGWYSVQALVEKKRIHTVMDQLTHHGAEDIFSIILGNSCM